MLHSLIEAGDYTEGDHERKVFLAPVLLGGGFHPRPTQRLAALVAADLHPQLGEARHQARHELLSQSNPVDATPAGMA
jgi:hypothetical protein